MRLHTSQYHLSSTEVYPRPPGPARRIRKAGALMSKRASKKAPSCYPAENINDRCSAFDGADTPSSAGFRLLRFAPWRIPDNISVLARTHDNTLSTTLAAHRDIYDSILVLILSPGESGPPDLLAKWVFKDLTGAQTLQQGPSHTGSLASLSGQPWLPL